MNGRALAVTLVLTVLGSAPARADTDPCDHESLQGPEHPPYHVDLWSYENDQYVAIPTNGTGHTHGTERVAALLTAVVFDECFASASFSSETVSCAYQLEIEPAQPFIELYGHDNFRQFAVGLCIGQAGTHDQQFALVDRYGNDLQVMGFVTEVDDTPPDVHLVDAFPAYSLRLGGLYSARISAGGWGYDRVDYAIAGDAPPSLSYSASDGDWHATLEPAVGDRGMWNFDVVASDEEGGHVAIPISLEVDGGGGCNQTPGRTNPWGGVAASVAMMLGLGHRRRRDV